MFNKKLVVQLFDFNKSYREMSPLSSSKGSVSTRLARKLSKGQISSENRPIHTISSDERHSNDNSEQVWEITKCTPKAFARQRRRAAMKVGRYKEYMSSDEDGSSGSEPTRQKKGYSSSEKENRKKGEINSDQSWSEDDSSSDEDFTTTGRKVYDTSSGRNKLKDRKRIKTKEYTSSDEDVSSKRKKQYQRKFIKYSSSDEDDSSEIGMQNSQNNKKAEKNEFQQILDKNREERLAFLKALQVQEVEEGLQEIVEKAKPRVKREKVKTEPKVLRRSQRVTREIGEASRKAKDNSAGFSFETVYQKNLNLDYTYEDFKKDMIFPKFDRPKPEFSAYDRKVIDEFNLDSPSIYTETFPKNICSLAWYPSPERLIIVAGCAMGYMNIWDIESQAPPFVFKFYSDSIYPIEFNPWNSTQMLFYTAGMLMSGDLVKHVFRKVCCFNENYEKDPRSCIEFFSASTYITSNRTRYIAIVDDRINRSGFQTTGVTKHRCVLDYWDRINSISIHPIARNFFITTSMHDKVCLWDLRMLQERPILKFGAKSTQSAYFSPVTGNSILTNEKGFINIFHSYNVKEISLKNQQKYNYAPKLLQKKFSSKVMWLPNSEEYFSCSDTDTVHVYNDNMQSIQNLSLQNQKYEISLLNINSFHPFRPAIAAVTSHSAKQNNSRLSVQVIKTFEEKGQLT